MVTLGKKNKQISLHQKDKVAKKVRQHHKEVKNGLKSQAKKAAGRDKVQEIPGSVPSKAHIVRGIAESKEQERALHKRRQVVLSALSRKILVDEPAELKQTLLKDSSRAFVGDVRKLMDEANVIIEVLDARDPNGTRSLEAEKEIKTRNKTLIFILNKIDLVPADNMKSWLSYLSKEARVFPFKASCQEQAKNIGGSSRNAPTLSKTVPSSAYGVDELINYLKSLTKGSKAVEKTLDKLVVGVVGVPNTGKSSVINSLKRKRICEAGNTPGITRNLQHIALDNHMTLIDSPGIVLAKSNDPAEFALRNCIRVEKLDDPVSVAGVIFKRCGKAQLECIYKLKVFETYEEFIVQLAVRCCPLKKGGIANIRLASVRLINDWNSGKIAFCTQPPHINTQDSDILTTKQEEVIRELTSKAVWAVNGLTEMEGSGPLKSIMDVDELDNGKDKTIKSDSDDDVMNE